MRLFPSKRKLNQQVSVMITLTKVIVSIGDELRDAGVFNINLPHRRYNIGTQRLIILGDCLRKDIPKIKSINGVDSVVEKLRRYQA